MQPRQTPFPTSVFAVEVDGLLAHPNPVTCVVMGIRAPITVETTHERIAGEVLVIRPGFEHRVSCRGGLRAMYLDGVRWTGGDVIAKRLRGRLAELADGAMRMRPDAPQELRDRWDRKDDGLPDKLQSILAALVAEPMFRMTQTQLASRLGMERTRALRFFKEATGMTFRQYKRWTGLQYAAHRIVAGELVRTAALDAGFADTAHLTRSFRHTFGLTPSQAIAGLPHRPR